MRKTIYGLILCIILLMLGSISATAQQVPTVPTETVQWDTQSRINILVLGMDRRPGARDNLNVRTDVIMIVSYDPRTQSVGVLDIPRDLHLAIIEAQERLVRVNTLLVEGESLAEGYGPYHAMQTLQLNLGMYIDAYIAFDFEAFIEFIDTIGGITVNNPYIINDPTFPDMNYGFDPFYLGSGEQYLNGYNALRFARTRHGDNDYARGQRQLEVVRGVRDRLAEPATLARLVTNAPNLISDLQGHFYTNIAPEQLVFLGLSMMESDTLNVGSINVDYSYDYFYNGETIRVPDRNVLSDLLVTVFGEDYWR